MRQALIIDRSKILGPGDAMLSKEKVDKEQQNKDNNKKKKKKSESGLQG